MERDDGSWLVWALPAPTSCRTAWGVALPVSATIPTVAGFALSVLKHLPETGKRLRPHDGWVFELVDLDGRKIDKLIASRPERNGPQKAKPRPSARASRTSVRSRRCRCARDIQPAPRSDRA